MTARTAREVLVDLGLPVLAAEVPLREAYARAFGAPVPAGGRDYASDRRRAAALSRGRAVSAAKASDLAPRTRTAATRPQAATEPPVTAGTTPPATSRPVRLTLDLDRDTHRALHRFAVEHDARAVDVLRVLLDTDPRLATTVAERLNAVPQ